MKKQWRWIILLGCAALFGISSLAAAETNQAFLDFCAAQKDIACSESFFTDVLPIEKKILKMKQSLKNKPTSLIAAQLQRFIQLSEKTESTPAEELKTRYLRWRLVQRQSEVQEKMQTISLSPQLIRSLRSTHAEDESFFHALRQYILPHIIAHWDADFVKKPYGTATGIVVDSDWQIFVTPIAAWDDLDLFLRRRWKINKNGDAQLTTLYVTPKDIALFWPLYLFKTKDDLESFGYMLVSNRQRVNTDPGYRRFNIKTAFTNIWPVRVIMPGETLSFLKASNFDMDRKELYERGTVISSDEEVEDYWGWLCGAATALYQGTVTNKWLTMSMRNHSKRYKSLYTATIDGKKQHLPWIDATIYSPSLDFTITNTKPYPIVVVMNYDGTYKWLESVFTLWKPADVGSLEYVGKRSYTATLNVKWGEKKKVTGQCHTWLINGKKQERCYKEIKG